MRGVPACREYPAHGIPTPLDPLQVEEHHEPGPLPPFEPAPPLPAGTPSPPAPLLGRGKGQGVPAREGVPGGLLGLWAVWAWERHEPGPLSSWDPLLLSLWHCFRPENVPQVIFGQKIWRGG